MTALIGTVKVTPPQAVPGQSVQLQVLDPTGNPYTANSNVIIALDGVPVPSRYYQFPTAGTRTISVYAAGNGTTETATATVVVAGAPLTYRKTLPAPGQAPAPGCIPFILLTQSLDAPYQATFSLATPPAARAAAARAIAALDAANTGKPAPAAPPAQVAPAGLLELQALFPAQPPGTPDAGRHIALPKFVALPAAGTSYVWTFGDGQTATTDSPTITHDYFPAITPGRVAFGFDVSCRIVHDNITVTRTLVLYSTYGACQSNGTTVPYVTGDVYASLNSDKSSFAASLLVHNIEATAVTINEMAIVPIWQNQSASFPAPRFTRMAQPVTVAPHASSLLGVNVLRRDLSSASNGNAVTGFIAIFQGTLAGPAMTETRPSVKAAIARPSVDAAILGRLHPRSDAASTVRFSRNVQISLQDQQLPPPPGLILKPSPIGLGALGAAVSPIMQAGGIARDPATSVVSVALTTPAPAPVEAAQVRHSVLSVLKTANIAAGAK
jgi:hypothetical protein